MAIRVSYSADIKMKAIEMRLAGRPVKQVMDELNIKEKSPKPILFIITIF